MKRHRVLAWAAAGAMALLPVHASAQIGQAPSAFRARWGAPTGTLATNESGLLRFAAQGMNIEVSFVHSQAQRIRCARPGGWTDEAISSLFALNAGNASWDELQRLTPDDKGGRAWMRSDEMAMAHLNGDTLEIIGSEWNRLLAQPPEPPPTPNQTAPTDSAAVTPPPPDARPPDPVCGNWLHEQDNIRWTVQVRSDGLAIMARLDDKSYCAVTTRWSKAAGTATGHVAYLFLPVAAPGGEPLPMAVATLAEIDTFRLQPETAEDRLDLLWAPEAPPRPLDFKRVDTLPVWKPKVPDRMPKRGDSRDAALRLLGPPIGTMRMASREVLVYPWGRIWIVSGSVANIE